MALDIRAVTTCGLGPVISANISDDYLQGSGLVKTRGSVELKGIAIPAVGTTVTFSYAGPAYSGTIPRQLRVISAMADPYRKTTKVELGCALTYMANRKPATVNPNTKDEDANGTVPCYVFSFATLPISAAYVLEFCATKLGLTLSSNPLTNQFSVDEFDLSAGYVQIISDLLVSENYFGMVKSGTTLQIYSFNSPQATGMVITEGDIIDLGPVGVGSLPGESTRVSYSTLRFKKPDTSSEESIAAGGRRNWESEETYGPSLPVSVTYETPEGATITEYSTFAAYSRSFSRYDRKDRLVESVTINTQSSAEVNGQWASEIASAGGGWNIPCYTFTHQSLRHKTVYPLTPLASGSLLDAAQSKTTEEIAAEMADRILAETEPASECKTSPSDEDSIVLSQTTTSYVSALQVAGSVNGARYKADDGGTLSFGTNASIVASRETITYDKDRSSNITKTITNAYRIGAGTIGGQQALAASSQLVVDPTTITSLTATMNELVSIASQLHYVGAEVNIRTEREYGLKKRPSQAERNNTANAKPGNLDQLEQVSETQWAVGSVETQATVELTLPYAPDDVVTWDGSDYDVIPSDAAEKAKAFGRIQNRLLMGNRYALALQLPAYKLPDNPFDPIYVQGAGATGQYRVNGCSWALTGDGVIASTDALFWGAAGADVDAEAFFPLPPGITAADLPPTPALD